MKKATTVILSLLMLLSIFQNTYAEPSGITCTTEVTGRRIRVSGQVDQAEGKELVVLTISDSEKTVVDSKMTESASNGKFQFEFDLPENLEHGDYTLNLATVEYQSVLQYSPSTNQSITCTTAVDGQNVQITGKIQNAAGKNQVALLVGEIDNILYIDQVESASDGSFQFRFKLPDGLAAGKYNFRIGSDADTAVYNGVIDYVPGIVTPSITCTTAVDGQNLQISGKIENADKSYTVTLRVGENGSIFTQQTTSAADGSFRFDVALPDTLSTGSYPFTLDAGGDAKPYQGSFEYAPPEPAFVYPLSGTANETVHLIATGRHIKSFENKIFTLQYNAEQIEPVNLFGAFPGANLQPALLGQVEILTAQPGCITFRMSGISIPEDKEWSGILNIFKFRFKADYSGNTTVTIQ